MIKLSPPHLATVKDILKQHVPECEVRAFGSRVKGPIKPYSDLDLLLISPKKIPRTVMIPLKEAFAESNLPFRVDLLDEHTVSDSFKNIIQKKYLVLQKATRASS